MGNADIDITVANIINTLADQDQYVKDLQKEAIHLKATGVELSDFNHLIAIAKLIGKDNK